MQYQKELKVAIDAAKAASFAILDVYHHRDLGVEIKFDNSPVTNADKNADKIIRKMIMENFPDHKMLTEESNDDKSRLLADYVWIVDPLDGTKDFIARNDEFATLIALTYKHETVVGVAYLPAKNEYYYAVKDEGAYFVDSNGNTKRIHVNNKDNDLIVLTSRFHLAKDEEAMIKKHADKIKKVQTYGSAIKGCLIARGEAELSYRFSSQTKEWDTASMQLIVEEAGGVMLKPDGTRILYNRDDVYNREGYIIANKKENILL